MRVPQVEMNIKKDYMEMIVKVNMMKDQIEMIVKVNMKMKKLLVGKTKIQKVV